MSIDVYNGDVSLEVVECAGRLMAGLLANPDPSTVRRCGMDMDAIRTFCISQAELLVDEADKRARKRRQESQNDEC